MCNSVFFVPTKIRCKKIVKKKIIGILFKREKKSSLKNVVSCHLFVNNYEIYFVKLFQCMTVRVHGLSSIVCLLLINLFKTIHL